MLQTKLSFKQLKKIGSILGLTLVLVLLFGMTAITVQADEQPPGVPFPGSGGLELPPATTGPAVVEPPDPELEGAPEARAEIIPQGGGEDIYEENDNLAEAYYLSGMEQTNIYGTQLDEDWFMIYVNQGSELLYVDLLFNHSGGDIDLYLYDFFGKELAKSTSASDNETIWYLVPQGATWYYLRINYVYGVSSANVYTLWWDDQSYHNDPPPGGYTRPWPSYAVPDLWENDDTFGAANWLNPNVGHVKNISPVGDWDYVKFDLDGNTGIILQTSGMGSTDTVLDLYSGPSFGAHVESSDNEGVNNHALIDRTCRDDLLPAGTYYARVSESGNDGTIINYQVHLQTYPCLETFVGGAHIVSNQPIVAIGRPHMNGQIMAYGGDNPGGYTVSLPMLFNDIWGGWDSTFTVQSTGTAYDVTFSLTFRDANDGSVDCAIGAQHLAPGMTKTYDLSDLPYDCWSGTYAGSPLPSGWFGGVTITSDDPVTAVARPRVGGTDAVTYNGFTSGSPLSFLPMLFKDKWGYQSAFYVQNLDPAIDADIDIEFYDNEGNFTCRYQDPTLLGPYETRGYWMGSINTSDCSSGSGFPVGGWAGSAVVFDNGTGEQIVTIGRPHIGTEVAAYNGFPSGNTMNYLPMVFKDAWGYDSAIYVQAINFAGLNYLDLEFYDVDGNYLCTYSDPTPLNPMSTRGYWMPLVECTTGGTLPSGGYAGSVVVSSTANAVAVSRAHLSDGEVVVYNGFQGGSKQIFVPKLFGRDDPNHSALYIQNISGSTAKTMVTYIQNWHDGGQVYCTQVVFIPPLSSKAVWLSAMDSTVCVP